MQGPPTEGKLDKLIAQNFSASLMSNQKWVKLLKVVSKHAAVPQRLLGKFGFGQQETRIFDN